MQKSAEAKRHDLDIRNIAQYIFDWYGVGAGGLQDYQQYNLAENKSTAKFSMSVLYTFYGNHFVGKKERKKVSAFLQLSENKRNE